MSTRQIAYAGLLAALYVVLGQVTGRIPNFFVGGGSNIALNMVVIVIAGILLGPRLGALAGLVGTAANALSPAGNAFEWAAVVPHTIMGLTAGIVGQRAKTFPAALTIMVGHLLNLIAFVIAGLLPVSKLAASIFALSLLGEIVIDLIVIVAVVPLLRPLVKRA